MSNESPAPLGHRTAARLLHNRSVVVIGDSIQRSVYKDLVLLLQRDGYLSHSQLRSKGELSFESDSLLGGGCRHPLHNGTDYREEREFRSPHHRVRFYFVTRVFSRYMSSVLEALRADPPDLVLVNSCLWDISRYKAAWEEDYEEDLHRFLGQLTEAVPRQTLVVWYLTMPLGRRVRGGFLTTEVAPRAASLRSDVVGANLLAALLADAYGADVLDLHFHFRRSLQQRTPDGVHWNALAHRRLTRLTLGHAAAAWGVRLPPAPPQCPTAGAGSRRGGAARPRPPAPPRPPSPPRGDGPVLLHASWPHNTALDWWKEVPHSKAQQSCTGVKDKQPIREALQPAGSRQANYTPATAPVFQPYPSDQNQPPGVASPYVTRNRHTRRRKDAPYSYSQRPEHKEPPYSQQPEQQEPPYSQRPEHKEPPYSPEHKEPPYSQQPEHIFFP